MEVERAFRVKEDGVENEDGGAEREMRLEEERGWWRKMRGGD